jgi:MFS family permease
MNLKKRLNKRLLPLYFAAFFQGFVLWYAIEKLFMRSIGFNDATIGIMVAIYAVVMLLAETPSGILADRWSRKGVLILASVALALSSLVCGISDSIPTYMVGAALWGVFYALYSGTYDSIVYDVLLEETGKSEGYEKYFGRIKIYDSIALVISALAGGVISASIGLQASYFWAIPFVILSVIALLRFDEPKLHKAHEPIGLYPHIKATFRATMQKGNFIYLLIAVITATLIAELIYEFSQLWLIALVTPIIFFGIADAVVLSTVGVGGLIAGRLNHAHHAIILLSMIVTLCCLGLMASRSTVLTTVIQFIILSSLATIAVFYNRLMHDSFSSSTRAGSSSAISSISRIIFIPLSLTFGFISNSINVFAATSILFVLSLISLALSFKIIHTPNDNIGRTQRID